MGHTATSAVRSEWLYETARMSQEILCDARAKGRTAGELTSALSRLPDAVSPVEGLVRQGLIFDVVLGCVEDSSSSHSERTINVVRRLLSAIGRPSALLDSPECRAADLIKERATLPLNVPEIARTVGCNQAQLRRLFHARYAITMRDWHRRCRVSSALKMFAAGGTKPAAVARAVGYGSHKNFYRALRQLTGQTPTELKVISQGALAQLSQQIVTANMRCLAST